MVAFGPILLFILGIVIVGILWFMRNMQVQKGVLQYLIKGALLFVLVGSIVVFYWLNSLSDKGIGSNENKVHGLKNVKYVENILRGTEAQLKKDFGVCFPKQRLVPEGEFDLIAYDLQGTSAVKADRIIIDDLLNQGIPRSVKGSSIRFYKISKEYAEKVVGRLSEVGCSAQIVPTEQKDIPKNEN